MGSKTMPAMPSITAIVDYWIQWEKQNQRVAPFGFFDWGEPACMACGIWLEKWDMPAFTKKETYPTDTWHIAKIWEACTLERCHIVARRNGGASTPNNFVMMCRRCHKDSPDHSEPEVLFHWMANRESFFKVYL